MFLHTLSTSACELGEDFAIPPSFTWVKLCPSHGAEALRSLTWSTASIAQFLCSPTECDEQVACLDFSSILKVSLLMASREDILVISSNAAFQDSLPNTLTQTRVRSPHSALLHCQTPLVLLHVGGFSVSVLIPSPLLSQEAGMGSVKGTA